MRLPSADLPNADAAGETTDFTDGTDEHGWIDSESVSIRVIRGWFESQDSDRFSSNTVANGVKWLVPATAGKLKMLKAR